ncbi:MAG: alkaline phosphatase family protein [Elainellaceae cyanobacterium]
MTNPVIAIGLDAADPNLIEAWMSQGYLPNLRSLREQGAYARLKTFEYYRAETPWTTFLTGCSPRQTGYWAPLKFYPNSYDVEEVQAYKFDEFPTFYSLCGDRRVAVFDMPHTQLSEQVNGLQVLAWGAHAPMTPSISVPEPLLKEVTEQYGEHPVLRRDHASTVDFSALKRLQDGLETGIARRAQICQDILQREPWDMFLTIFGETHAAGHYFWHLSKPDHPLYHLVAKPPDDPLLSVFESVDKAIGDIISKAPENAQILVFAAHGMGSNVMDLPSMFFLPEFLFRLNFPGKVGMARGKRGKISPNPIFGPRAKRGWLGTMWSMKHDANPIQRFLRQKLPTKIFDRIQPLFGKPQTPDLVSPFQLQREGDSLYFQPALWYKQFWSEMKAFAIPSFSEGYVRINLKGREANGIVSPEEYDELCESITQKLYGMKDARTGASMVKEVIRTRQSALDDDPKLPDADLVVIWQEEHTTDVVDCPDCGRIGPVPYLRTGSHRSDGFFVAKGPHVEPGTQLPNGHSLDLAATVLTLMDVPVPEYFEGKPLIEKTRAEMPVTSSAS